MISSDPPQTNPPRFHESVLIVYLCIYLCNTVAVLDVIMLYSIICVVYVQLHVNTYTTLCISRFILDNKTWIKMVRLKKIFAGERR